MKIRLGLVAITVGSIAVLTAPIARAMVVAPSNPFENPTLASYLAHRSGRVTAAVMDLASGRVYLYRPGPVFQTASVAKVAILATALAREQHGTTTLSPEDQREATPMIEVSDNTAADALWDEDGGTAGVAHFIAAAGMRSTTPGPGGFWGATETTAADQITLLQHLATPNALLSDASRSYELGLMEHVSAEDTWGVSTGPVAGTTVALKNGWYPIMPTSWQVNSVGMIVGSGRKYLIAVLTDHDPSETYGIATIAAISASVWAHFTPGAMAITGGLSGGPHW